MTTKMGQFYQNWQFLEIYPTKKGKFTKAIWALNQLATLTFIKKLQYYALHNKYAENCLLHFRDELPTTLALPSSLRESESRQHLSSMALLGKGLYTVPQI